MPDQKSMGVFYCKKAGVIFSLLISANRSFSITNLLRLEKVEITKTNKANSRKEDWDKKREKSHFFTKLATNNSQKKVSKTLVDNSQGSTENLFSFEMASTPGTEEQARFLKRSTRS